MSGHRVGNIFRLICSLALLWSSSASCAPLQVLTSIRPLALLVADLGGSAVQVQVLLPSNSDPHDFALRISDLQRLQSAAMVIWLGPEFERFLAKPMATKTAEQQLMLSALPNLHWPTSLPNTEAEHSGRDMHLWLNPTNAALLAQAISARLQSALPDQKAQLAERLQQLLLRLDASDAAIQAALGPLKIRPFGVYHDGYGHWVEHFGLRQTLSLSAMPAQHLSAKQLASARQQLAGAGCLITDVTEGNRQALAGLFPVPVLEADPLGQSRDYADFPALLDALQAVFVRCLQPRP